MTLKNKYIVFNSILYGISIFLLSFAGWKVVVGVILFGTCMNIDNQIIRKL